MQKYKEGQAGSAGVKVSEWDMGSGNVKIENKTVLKNKSRECCESVLCENKHKPGRPA